MKCEVEIEDGVIPAGFEPVAFRQATAGEEIVVSPHPSGPNQVYVVGDYTTRGPCMIVRRKDKYEAIRLLIEVGALAAKRDLIDHQDFDGAARLREFADAARANLAALESAQ